MVENMRSASTEPGTITKASSARTAHSETMPSLGLLLNLVLTQDLLAELWGDAKHEPGLLLQQRAVDTCRHQA